MAFTGSPPAESSPAQVAAPSLWRHPDFLKMWSAQVISAFGSRISREALGWAAMNSLHATAFQMGVLSAAGAAPVLLVGLFAGVWVDRLHRRPIMIWADLLRAAVLGAVPLAAFMGWLGMWQLYVVAGLTGALTIFFNVADQSYLPTLVPRESLMEGNSKLATTSSLAELGGPAVAGALIQVFTAPIAIVFDALSFLWSALWLGLIRKPEPDKPPVEHRQHVLADIRLGFRLLFAHPILRALAISNGIISFFGGFYGALYLAYMNYELGITPGVLGLLIAMGGLGALAAALIVRPLTRRLGVGRALAGGLLLSTVIMFLLPLSPPHTMLAVAFVFLTQIFGDFGGEIFYINEVTLRQSLLSHESMGRVNASMQFMGGIGLGGMLLAGVLAELIGLRATVAIAAAGSALGVAWLFFSPVLSVKRLPDGGA